MRFECGVVVKTTIGLLLASLAPFAQTPALPPGRAPGATLEGMVQKPGSLAAIPGAGVELSMVTGDAGARYVVAATKEGRFAFKDILPGEYRLAATRPGFVRSEYGQRGPNGSGVSITLLAGQEMKGVNIALVETGAISGRIYDRRGAPLENAQVQALKYAYKDGRRVLTTVRAVVTSDLGEYRLFWIPPGEYLIVATLLGATAPNEIRETMAYGGLATSSVIAPTGRLIRLPNDDASVPFYFPGVTDPQSAAPLQLGPAGNIGGIDITIRPGNARRVRGVVVNLPATADPAGSLASNARVFLQPRNPREADGGGMLSSIDRTSGAFEIPGALPGSYFVVASSGNFHGRAAVEVANADVEGVRVPVTPDVEVSVHASVEGRSANSQDSEISRLRILLNPDTSGPAKWQTTGAFLLRGVRPGDEYRLSIEQLPEAAYIKSIRMGDANVLDNGFRLDRPPENPIVIVIGRNAGAISGTAGNGSGQPLPAVTVVLAPAARERGDLYRKVSTDAAGRFRMTGIAPGDYKVFAWEDVENGAWRDLDFIRRYEDRGKPVHIDEGSELAIQVAVP